MEKCRGTIVEGKPEISLSKEDMGLLNNYLRSKAGYIDGWNGRSCFSEEELKSWLKGIPPRGLTFIKHNLDTELCEKINEVLDFITGLNGDPLDKLKAVRHYR